MSIETGVAINLFSVVFAAGIVWAEINQLKKTVEKMDKHGEKIAAIEAKLSSIEKLIE